MKKLYFTAVGCIVIISILFLFLPQNLKGESPQLISPVAKGKILGVNLWFPEFAQSLETDFPKITARSALFLESKEGRVLYSKNAQGKLPIASLVKVMTVLIALDYKRLDDQFSVSQKASEAEPDKMFLIPGEKFSLKELLYGIFLISANDAAEVLAEGTTGNREDFMNLMNDKAKQLGMNNTYFVNPTGLDEESEISYSTVYDLAILTRYLVRVHPEVVEIAQTPHIYFSPEPGRQDYDMYSGINLLTTYEGVVGFKTGYTPEAGYTLITLARKGGYEVIGVLLDSKERRDEARALLDYSFDRLGIF